MANVKRTAMGKLVDIDMVRLANEDVIAVGNMRVNARGDELGAGGKVVKTKAQAMKEFHKLNTPVATDDFVPSSAAKTAAKPAVKLAQPTAVDMPITNNSSSYVKPRGSFAEAIAEETEVHTELLDPAPLLGSAAEGVKRI